MKTGQLGPMTVSAIAYGTMSFSSDYGLFRRRRRPFAIVGARLPNAVLDLSYR